MKLHAEEMTKFYLTQSKLRPRSIEAYVWHAQTIERQKPLDEITTDWINENILGNNSIQPSTKRAYVIALRKFYEWQMFIRKLKFNPAKCVLLPRNKKPVCQNVSEETLIKIFNGLQNTREKAFLYLLYFTGLRATELTDLRLEDIDRTRRIITVRNGKGGKTRQVLYPPEFTLILNRYIEQYDIKDYLAVSVCTRSLGDKLTYKGLQKVVIRIAQRLKCKFHLHQFRHTFATKMYEETSDIYALQKLMGHSDLKTTAIYTHVTDKHTKEAYESAHFGDILLKLHHKGI